MAEELIERVDRALDGLLAKGECRSLQFHAERWMAWIAAAVPVFIAGQFYLFMFLISEEWFALYPMLLCIALALGLDVVGVVWVTRWRNRTVFARIMTRLHADNIRPHLCLCCEYDLKGSVSEHCPECGTALAPVMVEHEGDTSPQL